jgi:phosphopantothenoylcysteine decarboxylase
MLSRGDCPRMTTQPNLLSLAGREIVIGITGGVAAYKTAQLVSLCVQAGCGVSVVMTRAAQEFIGAATLRAISGRPVAVELFDAAAHPLGAHIELAERGELLCIAPATANFLGHAALGLADDLLTTLYLAFAGPVVVAPAMNGAMWQHSAVQRNVAQLAADGVTLVGPEEGWLSCRQVATGRMAEAATIFNAITAQLAPRTPA